MSSLTDSAAIFRYHRDMITMHGSKSSLALGWRDLQGQLIRFKVLAGIANLDGRTVLDAGCGYADLLPYLHELYPLVKYIGIEQIPELLEKAIERYGELPDTHFISGNFITTNLPITDYVLASGSLNYRNSDPLFIFKAISHLYKSCTTGLGFNLLRAVKPNELIVAYDTDEILKYCRSISSNVILKNDYADEDFTVFMYH